MKLSGAFMLPVFLSACVREWRTPEPVTPSTYQAAPVRSATSVGRLVRLAVLTPELHMISADKERAEPKFQQEEARLRTNLQDDVVSYLVKEKGYDARAVNEVASARDATTLHALGTRLGVDGIVLLERWVTTPWTTARALSNLALLNAPLISALRKPYFRAAIFETASGRQVWNTELSGEHPGQPKILVPQEAVFGNLENAIPPQLRQ